MVTIKDVAIRAQVSYTTVSHVVNGTRAVADKTRERVLLAIKQLRYVPSATARTMRTNRSYIVGMIVPNNSNPYFAEVIRGVEDACFESGYHLILCNSDDEAAKQRQYVRVLTERQVDGLVVFSSGDDKGLYALLARTNVPHVVVDRVRGRAGGGDVVQVDHKRGGYLAGQHLTALGHRRIGCILGPRWINPVEQRFKGFCEAVSEAGIDPAQCPLREADFTSAGGHRAMLDLLARPSRPTAVFAFNDLMAIGALSAIASTGLRVPEDISVVGFDDIALAQYANPPLTTVAQPMGAIGRTAAEILIDRINMPGRAVRREKLQPAMQVRKSTGRCPTRR